MENVPEEQPDNPDTVSGEQEEQLQRQKDQVQKILCNVRQNFGKINVAPEFNEEDLIPVEMPDLDLSDNSGLDNDEEDGGAEEDEANVEPSKEETEVSEATASPTAKANGKKSSRKVIRELDEKIAKYKQFLDRAKSKHFSAIRSVLKFKSYVAGVF